MGDLIVNLPQRFLSSAWSFGGSRPCRDAAQSILDKAFKGKLQENEMTREHSDPFEYDVALSFAGEDRAVAEEFGDLLRDKNISVFYDEYQAGELWGKDLVDHLVNIYSRKARYCVLLISKHYPLKKWTEAERTSAQERAFRDANEYILPIQLDDTEVPGINEATGYRDLRQHSVDSIVNLLDGKLTEIKDQSGPPSQSHDLRSGNVASTHRKSDVR